MAGCMIAFDTSLIYIFKQNKTLDILAPLTPIYFFKQNKELDILAGFLIAAFVFLEPIVGFCPLHKDQ
jgi:hypothetical protein